MLIFSIAGGREAVRTTVELIEIASLLATLVTRRRWILHLASTHQQFTDTGRYASNVADDVRLSVVLKIQLGSSDPQIAIETASTAN